MKPIFQSSSTYLGISEIEKASYLPKIARSMHTEIVGSTGVGKTESVILPLILNDVMTQKGIIFVDPKGDSKTFATLKRIVEFFGYEKSMVKIDLADPENSAKYNPLKVGSSSELKDKITGSIIWTEEYYKKVSERALLYIFNELERLKVIPTVNSICKLFNDKEDPVQLSEKATPAFRAEITKLVQYIKTKEADLEGVKTDLYLWSKSKFGSILDDPQGHSALDWIKDRKIVYINLNTLAFEESARRFGRLVLQDIKTAVQVLQSESETNRLPTSIYIDEFASIASSGFIELLNKARSANIQLTIAHQSYGDLTAVSPSFASQITDNTNVKILFRIDGPDSVDFYSKFGGTRKSFSKALQTTSGLWGSKITGEGTISEIDEFILGPNLFRTLKRGQAFVVTKIPYSVSKVTFMPIEERLRLIELDWEKKFKGRKSWLQTIRESFCWA